MNRINNRKCGICWKFMFVLEDFDYVEDLVNIIIYKRRLLG